MRKLIVAVAGLALLVSACSGGGEEIGRVSDRTFQISTIEALYVGDSVPVDETFRQTLFQVLAGLRQVAAIPGRGAHRPDNVSEFMGNANP